MSQSFFLFSPRLWRDPLGDWQPTWCPHIVPAHRMCCHQTPPSLYLSAVTRSPLCPPPARPVSVVLWSSHSADLIRAGSGDKKSYLSGEETWVTSTQWISVKIETAALNESPCRLCQDSRGGQCGCWKQVCQGWAELWSQRRHSAHKILCLDNLVRISETVFAIMW